MRPPLLKICGLTTIPDLRLACECADFVGVVVASTSPRSVTVEVARYLARLAPDKIVLVTNSADETLLSEIVTAIKPRALQLHGPQASALARTLHTLCPVWVAVALPRSGERTVHTLDETLAQVHEAAAAGAETIVLDTAVAGKIGGTGIVSDWELAADIVAQSPLPVLLAGGIRAENAAAALAAVQPAGLDASSQLERTPGRKCPMKLRALAQAVRG